MPRLGRCGQTASGCNATFAGRYFKMVGGSHLMAAHGWTTAEYRDAFGLNITTSTVGPQRLSASATRCLSRSAWASGATRSSAAAPGPRCDGARSPNVIPACWPSGTLTGTASSTGSRSGTLRCGRSGGAVSSAGMSGAPRSSTGRTVAKDALNAEGDAPRSSRLRTVAGACRRGARSPCCGPTSSASGIRCATRTLTRSRSGQAQTSRFGGSAADAGMSGKLDPGTAARAAVAPAAQADTCRGNAPLARCGPSGWQTGTRTGTGTSTPFKIAPRAGRVWICSRCRYCGHEWETTPLGRGHSKGGCRSCSRRSPSPTDQPGLHPGTLSPPTSAMV